MNSCIYTFNSGLRIVHRKTEGARSVAVGVMTGVGSANETKENNGISHFIEHMLFKGTKKRSAFDISCEIDGLGAQINAFTSKQVTCYYTLCVDEYTENCVEILSDLLFESVFPEDEMDREKGVVLEEIAMSEDDPQDVCLETLSTAYFQGNTLGFPIIGERENIQGFTKAQITDYIEEHYCAGNTVIAIIGNIEYDAAVKLAERYFEGRFGRNQSADWSDRAHTTSSLNVVTVKDIEQANIAFAFPSITYKSDDEAALMLLNTIFGSGMSSRLFQNIREKQGLAYSVYSYPSTYINNGNMNIYIGTNVQSVEKATKSVREEIETLKKSGLTAEEIERGKRQLKGMYVLGQENSASLMRLYARQTLFTGELFDFDRKIAAIDEVTSEQINRLVEYIFDFDKVSASYVGRKTDANLLEIIKGV